MNNPNPFVPQGSLLERQSKSRSSVKLAVLCVLAINVLGLMALLMQGCKREQTEETAPPLVDTNLPAMDTNLPAMTETNPPALPPMVTPTPPPAVEAGTTEYVVVKGDTLAKIAKAHGTTVKAIQDANPGVVPTRLKVGQKLAIPAPTAATASATATASVATAGMGNGGEIYTVKSGDTLTAIARAHGTTVKAIEAANSLSTTKIKVGQKLKIPSAAPAAAPEPAPVAPAPPTPAGQ